MLNIHYWSAFDSGERKITFANSGLPTTKNNIVQHKKRCSAETLLGTQCPNFSTTSHKGLVWFINLLKRIQRSKTWCYLQVQGFYAFRQHKSNQHLFAIKTTKLEPEDIINEVNEMILEKELGACLYFLVILNLRRATHKVFNYTAENLNETVVRETLNHFFNNQNFAAKMNLAFGFFEENRQRKVKIFSRTRKSYPAGQIENCYFQGRLDEVKWICQQNRRHRVVQWWKTKHKVELLQIMKFNCISCFTRRRTCGVQERSFTWNSIEKWYNQLSHIWRNNQTTLYW